MDVHSPGFATDLRLLELGGSEVVDHGTYLVVRTPANPTFFWGNFLLLPTAPRTGEVDAWVQRHRDLFGASHVSIGVDRGDSDLRPLRDAGLTVEVPVTMTATEVVAPPHPNHDVDVRPMAGDDWEQLPGLTVAGEDEDSHVTTDFVARKALADRSLVENGHGRWWGAFEEGALVASLGIVRAGDGLVRFQSVQTHPDHRGRGLCGTLVHRASRDAVETLDARLLVVVADPDYLAIRIYRSLGFVEGSRHAEATLRPPLS